MPNPHREPQTKADQPNNFCSPPLIEPLPRQTGQNHFRHDRCDLRDPPHRHGQRGTGITRWHFHGAVHAHFKTYTLANSYSVVSNSAASVAVPSRVVKVTGRAIFRFLKAGSESSQQRGTDLPARPQLDAGRLVRKGILRKISDIVSELQQMGCMDITIN